ncbi:hypothetical protein QBC47DRAFT_335950 [Echria macrotheca]|uniref:FAD-binding domain-containing protein n=1 Tax=Echria macrotheca TaxID=438768 RepID=A0AAJ0FBV8_9PEZI|nr:hypothetical protein QBC47DRAFT_335950 [Echria macrotheca]
MERPQGDIIIIGAGVAGLLLAQHLQKSNIPFRIFERDADLTTRGVGWGLTLHWSLPALRDLLPDDLFRRLPEVYVDRVAVERAEATRFPFYDLSTGELKAATPPAPESQRIRVARDRFRQLLASGINIQWAKAATNIESRDDKDGATVHFADGTSSSGKLIVACDGGKSRVRKALFPNRETYKIPIRVMGARVEYTPDEIQPIKKLDPVFLQGTASKNDTYVYFSILDAPGNNTPGNNGTYIGQVIISWPIRDGFFGRESGVPFPKTNKGGIELIKTFASTWAEPFRSLAASISPETEIKYLELYDWVPPRVPQDTGNVALVGDAFHPMSMYRGEGANHAILDVLDFVHIVLPHVDVSTQSGDGDTQSLHTAIEKYAETVTARARPAVLASRQACLDAHDWPSISGESPLLSRRAMQLDFDDSAFD